MQNSAVQKKIRVVQLQSGLPSSGNAIHRLHSKLIDAEVNSVMLVMNSFRKTNGSIKTISDPFKNFKIVLNNKLEKFILRNRVSQQGTFSVPLFGHDVTNHEFVKNADIIIIHWAIGGFLNLKGYEYIFELKRPVIIFMHDMWNITGGCHYSMGCNNYIRGCLECPIFRNKSTIARNQLRKKSKVFSKYENVVIAAPSKWLTNCAMQSVICNGKTILHLPNIIDTKIFKPFNKLSAKAILSLNPDKKVLAFGAKTGPDSQYKGWEYMLEAVKILKKYKTDQDFQILIFGSEYDNTIAESLPYQSVFTGYLYDDYALNIVYNAVDVFIVPSIADNLPSTILESQACGTPVVGFEVGGIPDMIIHKKNGYLAKFKDSHDLADGIIYCLESRLKGYLPPELNPDLVINKYIQLFHKLTKE
jgi:glycosyltransferase involved in cell wall biosynthesis